MRDRGKSSNREDDALGVYIHFPWCRNLCSYCDFPVTIARRGIPHQGYLAAICAELEERAILFPGRRLVSIYFGGGTPSLWEPACVAAAVARVCAAFAVPRPDALEITVEANPTDCTAERMEAWRAAGVNRLSLGVQSYRPDTLVALGRDHCMGDGAAALGAALEAGFAAVSADIIFGTPGHAGAGPDPSALAAADTGVGHLSVYELTIEPRTALGRAAARGELVPTGEDTLAEQYAAIHEALIARGYEHYEISSFARPGARAVHNSLYWRGAEYLGLGCGASSFLRTGAGGRRWSNDRSVRRYMRAAGEERVVEREELSGAQLAADRLWLGLRTVDGIAAEDLSDRPQLRDWLLENRLATLTDGRICPTLRGFLYSDQVAARILERAAAL